MNKKSSLMLTLMFVFILTSAVYGSNGMVDSNNYGIISLLPPIIAIVLAFITKNVIISLFLGAITGTFILTIDSSNILKSIFETFDIFINLTISTLSDPWNSGIILQVLVIGGVIELITKMGGAQAVAEKLTKYAKTPVSAQIITWTMGILLFFDDYANALIVGPIMKPIFDKLKISREKLAFIVDATAAPIAGVALISTWIGLEVGLIQEGYASVGVTVDGYSMFLQTIPYRFYNIYMLIFVFISAITLRDFGNMYKVELSTRRQISLNDESEDEFDTSEPEFKGDGYSALNAVLPILTLIFGSLFTFYYSGYKSVMVSGSINEVNYLLNAPFSLRSLSIAFGNADASVALLESALLASIVAIGIALIRKIFTLSKALETWIAGMEKLLLTGVILILAWNLGEVISQLGVASFLIENLGNSIKPEFLPSIIFILSSVISFSTGTAYGTLAILMPIAIPMAVTLNPNTDLSFTIVTASAVLAGAIFGDHCSPISDTTILSSTGSSCEHINHVNTQVLYAIVVFVISILFGYLPAGFGVPIFIIMPIGIISIIVIFKIFGKKVSY